MRKSRGAGARRLTVEHITGGRVPSKREVTASQRDIKLGSGPYCGQKGTVPDPDSGNRGKPGREGLGGKAPTRKVSGTQTLSPSSRNPLPASRRLGDRDSPAQPPSGQAVWAHDEGPPSWPGCPGDRWWDGLPWAGSPGLALGVWGEAGPCTGLSGERPARPREPGRPTCWRAAVGKAGTRRAA